MKRFYLSVFSALLLTCATALMVEVSNADRPVDIRLIQEKYGSDIVQIYRNVEGMPRFDDSDPLPVLQYRRNESPCNDLFIRENPEMAEKCNRTREIVTIENRYQKKLTVHIVGGKLESIEFNIPMGNPNPLKTRKVTLLHGSLIVHDIVMNHYSHNHAKIYFFPTSGPRIEFDENHNLIISFGARDYIKFMAEDFRRTKCRGFRWRAGSVFYRKGTRSLPDIAYQGEQPYMTTVNWSYPPLDGFLDLYNDTQKVGRIPTSILYQKQKKLRAKPLFTETGLLGYLKDIYAGERVKCSYSPEIQRCIQKLLN
ncbi:MAG: hypothetical protein R6U38_04815 [Desulfatiglandaceae bacterium]